MWDKSVRAVAIGFVCTVLGGCSAGGQSSAEGAGQDEAATTTVDADAFSETEWSKLAADKPAGPKKRVAVAEFGASGKFASRYGDWDIGGGLTAQLTRALEKTGRFIVLERASLDKILREQNMREEGLQAGSTGPEAGQLLGAQLLIRGEVTEFGPRQEGGGFSIGSSFGGIGGALGLESETSYVAMEVRLIDPETSEVEDTFHTEAQADSSGMSFDIDTGLEDITFGGEQFNNTPIGVATRAAMEHTVRQILAHMEQEPWKAHVAKVDGPESIYISAGKKENLSKGDRLKVLRTVENVTDPTTGEVLTKKREEICRVNLVEVSEEYAVAQFVDGKFVPERGDVVRFLKSREANAKSAEEPGSQAGSPGTR